MRNIAFHPLIRRWFEETFASPTEVQVAGWERISTGENTLIAAPTGSGKTLTAFLWALNQLVEAGVSGNLEDRTYVVYVSPLKALGNDIEKNLKLPLGGVYERADASGTLLPTIRVAVRSGDTPQSDRQKQAKRPPHILITTPESLYILLTSKKGRDGLREASTVIVDEIHALAGDKRGSHLALSLERLDALAGRRLQRIGLSATQKPIDEIAALLVGHLTPGIVAPCAIVDVGHRREMDLRVETMPDFELGPIAGQEMRTAIFGRFVDLIREHRTTIVFVNTRRMVERVAHALSDLLGKEKVAAHHGSMSRETRLAAEQGLKAGTVPVVVATASLELGIDVGHVDLVVHFGATRSLATLLQRVGRSGHFLGAVPKGILFPLTRDELVQCAAAVRAVYQGELDRVVMPTNARDILAQQIVAIAASEEIGIESLWELVRRAHPYRDLTRKDFDDIIEMLAEGVSTQRGRHSAHLHFDRVNGSIKGRRGARLAAITSGGAIPDTADFDVIEDPEATFVGKVNEDFAIESLAGDIFLLGNKSWRITRVEKGRIRVVDAQGAPPNIPFWLGEAPARTAELCAAVADLRREIAERRNTPDIIEWIMNECRTDRGGAEQLHRYISETAAALGAVPTLDTIIAERFFDEAGGMQLVLHTPFGGRINRALGLSMRKRFCVSFNFELQAAATDDGVVISLGEQHSFPLDSVFSMVRSHLFEDDLIQAALQSPMFTNRWRWNISRALVLLRFMGGKKVPMQIQRMRAEDLVAAVFPAQLACQDNRTGPIEPVDHPLVNETLDNCLHEAMDSTGLRTLLEAIEQGRVRTIAVETPAPSPMSHEILNANPYAFLDDAPLEERRARAVSMRRVDPDLASGIGALDAAAIAEVRKQAWPEPRDVDEVHDALLTLGLLPETDATPWLHWIELLIERGRAARIAVGDRAFVIATERASLIGEAESDGSDRSVRSVRLPEAALDLIIRGWMDCLGPATVAALAARLGFSPLEVEATLCRLESTGAVLRGRFSPTETSEEFCERGLLARLHRLTLGRLRKEIESVSSADFVRFLLRWQHVARGTQLHGRDGIRKIIEQLQGLELPGPAWERDVLAARISKYDPADLEQLCLAGEIAWGRLSVGSADSPTRRALREIPAPAARRSAPTRSAPLAFVLREDLPDLLEPLPEEGWRQALSPVAEEVLRYLEQRGASFLADVSRALRRLPTEVEDALWELVASGLVTGDGIAGLRTLLLPEEKRRERPRLRALPGRGSRRLMPVGRWSLLRQSGVEPALEEKHEHLERYAHRLLQRYGIVLRELCQRERYAPAWRALLSVFRRLEARGEVRGGRFVSGFSGEQFALAEAVDAVRAVRREKASGDVVLVASTDPLNVVGVLTPGARVPRSSGQVIAYRDGVPVEVGDLGTVLSRLRQQEIAGG